MNRTTATDGKSALIAIVDDEACMRESVSSLVRSVGYETKEYVSTEDFLLWGWWDQPSCIILDVRLPAAGGLKLQQLLVDQHRAYPIVFISGHATANEQRWAMTIGAVAFLRKPFSDKALLDAVNKSAVRLQRSEDLLVTPLNHVCPLCRESARLAELASQSMVEADLSYVFAMNLLNELNPAWCPTDGLCERCWKFYVALGRAIRLSTNLNESALHAARRQDLTAGVWQKG